MYRRTLSARDFGAPTRSREVVLADWNLKGAWGEHGAWAVVLISLGAGFVLAWPPPWPSLLLLPAAALFTGAKGLAQRARRTGSGYGAPLSFAMCGCACAVPAALAAPIPFAFAAILLAPFSALYFLKADSPQWTRSLAVEAAGVCFLASAGPLAVLAGHPDALADGALFWAAIASLFLPGVVRARLGKDGAPMLRAACIAASVGGAALATGLAWGRFITPWGPLYAALFLEDIYRALTVAPWTTRRLGIVLTVKGACGALLLALAWRPLA